MNKQNLNLSPPNQKLRTIAEAAYLVSLIELNEYSKKKNTLKESYRNTINNSDYFNSLKEQKYELFTVMDNKKDGFYAIVLRNYNGEMLISIRGTDFFNFNILQIVLGSLFGQSRLTSNIVYEITSGDLYNDLQIVLGKIPNQYKSAETFVTDVIKACPSYGKIMVTGHSLGGLLAQLISAKFGIDTIVFDSPGAKKPIEKLVGDNFNLQKITIINELPNFINTCGEHVKTPIAINNGGVLSLGVASNLLGAVLQKSWKKERYLFSHGMKDILNSINKDGVFKQVPIKIWPKNSLSFYSSMEAYNAMPDIYDRHIYQMWEKRCKRKRSLANFAFESYKSDFLKHKLTKGSDES